MNSVLRIVDTKKLKSKEKRNDFCSLRGSLKSDIKLTDKQLREARNQFEIDWAQNT